MKNITFIKSVTELHQLEGLDKPAHPLISIHYFDLDGMNCCVIKDKKYVLDIYQIVLEDSAGGHLRYGQNAYGFEKGSLIFLKPGQVFYSDGSYNNYRTKGWSLSFHPDLIRQSELGNKIDEYTFFSYAVNEALCLSEEEKSFVSNIVSTIETEYRHNVDQHSHELINTNLKLLLDYSRRYYDRQFYRQTTINKDIVTRFEQLLKDYYDQNKQIEFGVPTVKYCGTELQLSPNYLSDLLKKETGRNALNHIHAFLIEKAKTKLLNTPGSISQVAYNLGFEHAPYFSKLFRKKTGMSPKEFIESSIN